MFWCIIEQSIIIKQKHNRLICIIKSDARKNTIRTEIQRMKNHWKSQSQDKIESEGDFQNYVPKSSESLNEDICET